jgi:hypothetical protein
MGGLEIAIFGTNTLLSMSGFNGPSDWGNAKDSPEEAIRFYQQLGFFVGANPATIVEWYTDDHYEPPRPQNPWDDVFLFSYTDKEVWTGDPEADVCAQNKVYSEILPQWALISDGAFAPVNVQEHWQTNTGPITVSFELGGSHAVVRPGYQEDWIDLGVLLQINRLIAGSGKQFECAFDGNFALVMCVSPETKAKMRAQRRFPFAW